MKQLLLSILLTFAWVATAQASLDIDISEPNLEITSGFNGDTLTLFGTAFPKGDVIILVRGPRHETTVRRKVDVMGLWIQAKSIAFENVPGYYNIASSKDVREIATRNILAEHRLGLNSLTFQADEDSHAVPTFQEALIQNMQLKRLYSLTPDAVVFLNDNLFKTRIHMPPHVPLGNYTIEAFLFKDGVLIDKEIKPFRVAQAGMTGEISRISHESPFIYGLALVCVALLSGIGASLVLRRD